MRIKKKNVARLASISALGAGALGVAAGTAQASSIVYAVLPSNAVVGPDGKSVFRITFPGSSVFNNFLTAKMSVSGSSSNSAGRVWNVRLYGAGVQFRVRGSFLSLVNYGYLWGGGGTPINGATIGWRRLVKTHQTIPGYYKRGPWVSSPFVTTSVTVPNGQKNGHLTPVYAPGGYTGTRKYHSTHYSVGGLGPFTNQYALFQFQDNGQTLYGWLELSNSMPAAGALGTGFGPNVTLQEYGYDTNGNPIMAGDTGEVPEPSTMSLTGLAALALGATGLRRWRAARKPAA